MPDPFPVAKDHAAIQNKISLLLSSQSSLLKTLNPTPTASRKSQQPHHTAEDADADLFKHANPNEGVGFVRQSGDTTVAQSKQDKALRGRLIGKQKREEERKKKLVESESEEEQGRSGLGKRKRKTVVAQVDEEEKGQDEKAEDVEPLANDADEQESKRVDTRPKKKKNKKKRKHAE